MSSRWMYRYSSSLPRSNRTAAERARQAAVSPQLSVRGGLCVCGQVCGCGELRPPFKQQQQSAASRGQQGQLI